MGNLLIRLLLNALALWLTTLFVPGVHLTAGASAYGWLSLALAAGVFGLANALLRPFIRLLPCPLAALMLGLGTFALNAALLLGLHVLSAELTARYAVPLGLTLDTLSAALLGGLFLSVVSVTLSLLVPDTAETSSPKG